MIIQPERMVAVLASDSRGVRIPRQASTRLIPPYSWSPGGKIQRYRRRYCTGSHPLGSRNSLERIGHSVVFADRNLTRQSYCITRNRPSIPTKLRWRRLNARRFLWSSRPLIVFCVVAMALEEPLTSRYGAIGCALDRYRGRLGRRCSG